MKIYKIGKLGVCSECEETEKIIKELAESSISNTIKVNEITRLRSRGYNIVVTEYLAEGAEKHITKYTEKYSNTPHR